MRGMRGERERGQNEGGRERMRRRGGGAYPTVAWIELCIPKSQEGTGDTLTRKEAILEMAVPQMFGKDEEWRRPNA